MLRNLLKIIIILTFITSAIMLGSSRSHACGHEGVFFGLGYEQLIMYTPEKQLNAVTSERINFGPGFGATALVGYDIKGTRWGVQLPFEYSRLKLNHDEWVNYFGAELEGIFHIKEWKSGLDFHLVGGVGWGFLSEGDVYNNSKNNGITASLGPGLSYFFSRTEKVSGAVSLEIPFRFVNFFGNHLSRGGTSVGALPIRLTMQIGF